MLKYEGRKSNFSGGIEYNIINDGKPLAGVNLFRNKLAQQFFDKLRNQPYLADYGRMENNKNVFYFQFLNGEIRYYTRKDILRIAKDGGWD